MLKLSFIRIFPGELFLKSLKDNFMMLDEKIANVESAAMTYDKLAQNVKFFSEFAEVFWSEKWILSNQTAWARRL